MKYFLLSFCCVWFCQLAIADSLRVENRPSRSDEIGYRPADETVAKFNPPSFTWLHEKPAQSYFLQWSQTSTFEKSVTVSNLQFNCHTHHSALSPGRYFWRYRFVSAKKELSEWSATRQFTINENAVSFPMPSKIERRETIPSSHPRLLMRPEELPRLRQLAGGREAHRFAALKSAADKYLNQPPTPEPDKRGSASNKKNLAEIENWWPNREKSVLACNEAELLAFVYLITQEKKYGRAARDRIVALAKWDPDGNTNFRLNCEAAKPLLHRISRAYDWAYDALSSADRKLVQTSVARRIHDAWESGEVGRGVGHINRPFGSHGNRTWHKIGESGIVFLGEIPEAEMWLDYALNKYYACYPVWSDSDGGWHEGAAYLGGYMSKAVWWLHAAQSALKLDPLKKPFFSQVGDFPLYVAPPNSPNIGFGDLSFQRNVGGWGGFMEYFTRVATENPNSNAAQWRWWNESWKTSSQSGILGFLYAANLPSLPESIPPTNLPPSKVFHGIGVASLHTSLLNSSNDVHFLFKSSPFGSQSHGHNSQNTFQLNAYGDALLVACTYRDLHGSEFHYKWAHETVSQNGVLVNGIGQVRHNAMSRGKIVEEQLTREWDYIVGDAKEAYGNRLERALRHVVFIKPDVIVIYDDLIATDPSDFQFMLHGLSEFDVSSATAELHIQQPNSGATIRYLSDAPVKLRQWDGFPFKMLRNGKFPNQWHVEAATTTKALSLQMFTVIAPHQGNTKPTLNVERLKTTSADGLRININGRESVVAFRKQGVEKGEFAGFNFDSRVLVKTSQDEVSAAQQPE